MASSTDDLDNKGKNETGRLFLTGATGFLGGHLGAELLRRRYALTVLARPQGERTAKERIGRLLEWTGLGEADFKRLKVEEGYIDRPRLGLPGGGPLPARGFDEIIHCASDTSFSERKRARVERANIAGLENLIEFAAGAGCTHFHYLSTAYAAGRREGVCREELVDNDRFHNVYEESKYRAERLASEKCRELGIPLSIYRPSIVYGDSRTGRTMRFNALYYPIRTVLFLRDLYETDIRERGGGHALAAGVKKTERGGLFLPIRVESCGQGGLNLIPIDYFVKSFVALMENRPEGGVFHIVNPRPASIGELISFMDNYFGIEGMEAVGNGVPAHPRNPLETIFDSYLEIYGPYMQDTRIFENAKTQEFLSQSGIECPAFDYNMFRRCMDYALECDWGRKLEF